MDGYYQILWSSTTTFDPDKTIVVGAGQIPDGVSNVVATFTVPESAYGVKHVRFVRIDTEEHIGFLFSVIPSVKVTPPSVKAGGTANVIGTGFPDEDTIVINLDSKTSVSSKETNKSGSFTCSIIIPEDTIPGGHHLVVSALHIYTQPVSAALNVLPKENPIAPQQENGENTDTEPSNSSSHTIVLEDKSPPPLPTPIAPMGHNFGLFGAKQVTFTWAGVSDPSGVSYTLEIAKDVNFSMIKPGWQRSGLTETSCTIYVTPGTYYWRVKAIDDVGNESYWSYAPHAFKVGEFSALINDLLRALGVL